VGFWGFGGGFGVGVVVGFFGVGLCCGGLCVCGGVVLGFWLCLVGGGVGGVLWLCGGGVFWGGGRLWGGGLGGFWVWGFFGGGGGFAGHVRPWERRSFEGMSGAPLLTKSKGVFSVMGGEGGISNF